MVKIAFSIQATRSGTLSRVLGLSRSGLDRCMRLDFPVPNLYRGSWPAKYRPSYGVRDDRVRAIRDDVDERRTGSATEIGPCTRGWIWFQTSAVGDS